MEVKTYLVTADIRVKGVVTCNPDEFQERVEEMINNAEFDEYQFGSVDWDEGEEYEDWN